MAHFVSRQGRRQEAREIFEAVNAAMSDDTPVRTRAIHCLLYGRHLAVRDEHAAAEVMLREAVLRFEAAGPGPPSQRGVWDARAARAALASLKAAGPITGIRPSS